MPIRRLILWTAFLALIGVELYGFATTHVLTQRIWSEAGARRWIAFVLTYVLVAGTTLIWRPRLCIPLLLAIVAAWTLVAVGWKATFAALLLLLGAWQLGRLLMRTSDANERPELSLLLGLAIYSLAQGLLLHFAINGVVVAALFVLLPLGLGFRFGDGGLRPHLPSRQLAFAIIGLPLTAHWLVALAPETSNDALTMHLAAPATIAHAGYWSFDFHDALWALMPMGADWVYTLGYLLGGEAAARLINFALLCVLGSLVFKMCRYRLTELEASLVTAMFLSTPLVQLVTGSLFVENFWTAMIVGAFAALWTGGFWIAGILLGAAVSAKLGALAFAIPLLLVIPLLGKGGVRALLLFLLFAAPPYVTAYAKTGNPIFPFKNEVFGSSENIPTERLVRDLRFERPLGWRTLYDVTFHTERFIEGQAGAAGFQYLLLVPLAVLAAVAFDKKREWLAVALAIVGFVLVFAMQSNIRYCYPAMALASVAFARTIADCKAESKALYRSVAGACLAITALNMYFLAASGYLHRDFWLNPLSKNEAREYVEQYAPARLLIDDVNRIAAGETVMFVDTVHTAGLLGKPLTSGWYHWPLVLQLDRAITAQEVLQIANERGAKYFISPQPSAIMRPAVGPFLTLFTDVTRESGGFQLRTLKPEFLGAAGLERARQLVPPAPAIATPRELAPLRPGNHEDDDSGISYSGLWARAGLFPGASSESFMYSNIPGAEADLSFEGSSFVYVYSKAFNRGRAAVRIDNGEWEVLDQYAPEIQWQAVRAWTGLQRGVHRVVIRVLPERNPDSEGYYVDVDAIVIR